MARLAKVLTGIAPVAALTAGLFASGLGCGGSPHQPTARADYAPLMQPGTREPTDEAERELLGKLDTLAPDVEARLDGSIVLAGAPYDAASGRVCRRISLRPAKGGAPPRYHLVCKVEGAWAFVPDVLRASPAGGAR